MVGLWVRRLVLLCDLVILWVLLITQIEADRFIGRIRYLDLITHSLVSYLN